MACSISLMQMNSSAEWLRALSPGPIFSEGNGISAWSLSVGEPNGTKPIWRLFITNGCPIGMCDEDKRNERAFSSHFFMCFCRKENRYSFW